MAQADEERLTLAQQRHADELASLRTEFEALAQQSQRDYEDEIARLREQLESEWSQKLQQEVAAQDAHVRDEMRTAFEREVVELDAKIRTEIESALLARLQDAQLQVEAAALRLEQEQAIWQSERERLQHEYVIRLCSSFG